ncbi:importin beta-like SAD2 [Iris pallida]|uniref:Importin beta-like SAD2 n=1 Tax=Iris pallida TaxID=29817 RepID=A0AAX6I445_IRIPA|nr:importin beta-like SAD2 [Iris pallida]
MMTRMMTTQMMITVMMSCSHPLMKLTLLYSLLKLSKFYKLRTPFASRTSCRRWTSTIRHLLVG